MAVMFVDNISTILNPSTKIKSQENFHLLSKFGRTGGEIRSDFFGKDIYGRNAPFENEAIDNLKQLDINDSIGEAITIIELKAAGNPPAAQTPEWRLPITILDILNNCFSSVMHLA